MPPKKRNTTKATATKRTATKRTTTKRTTIKQTATTTKPPSTRLAKRSPIPTPPRPQAALRPVDKDTRPQPTHEIIELFSTSPPPLRDAAFGLRPYTDVKNVPCNGIPPTDSTQDIIINSIEPLPDIPPPFPPPGFTAHAFAAHPTPPSAPLKGVQHYLSLTAAHPHPIISSSFDTYVATPPPTIPLRPRMPTPAPQTIDLGPSAQGVNYWAMPRRDMSFRAPIYAGVTTNPLIPAAVLKLVERNVPFVEWGAERGYLPNAVGQHLVFPQEIERGEGVWLEEFEGRVGGGVGGGGGNAAKDTITTLFLPNFFLDRRHALLYFTRKSVSGNFAALLCAPCTTEELGRLGLLRRVTASRETADHGDPIDAETNGDPVYVLSDEDLKALGAERSGGEGSDAEGNDAEPGVGIFKKEATIGWDEHHSIQWGDMMVAVGNGRWIERRVDREMWGEAVDVVGREWGIRMGLCVRALAEGGVEARARDRGLWGVSGVD